jgi:ArsR family transcriptional regulator
MYHIGLVKPALPKPQLRSTVSLFAALAHPMRLHVLVALHRKGPMSAGELQRVVKVEQSALSHQLAALRRARLVATERNGRHVIYSLADHHVAHIVEDGLKHAGERR